MFLCFLFCFFFVVFSFTITSWTLFLQKTSAFKCVTAGWVYISKRTTENGNSIAMWEVSLFRFLVKCELWVLKTSVLWWCGLWYGIRYLLYIDDCINIWFIVIRWFSTKHTISYYVWNPFRLPSMRQRWIICSLASSKKRKELDEYQFNFAKTINLPLTREILADRTA